MGNNEVTRDAPHASQIAKTKILISLNFLLNPSIFPGSLQGLTSSFQTKYMSSGAPFVSPSANPNISPSIYPLPAPIILPSKDSKYFIIDQTNSTPVSNLRRHP